MLCRYLQASKWNVVVNPPGTPRQQNGHDCGIFAIMCANYQAADRDFDFSQREVHSFFRAMCALECYTGRLRQLDSSDP
jgi:Ulp1 family protease